MGRPPTYLFHGLLMYFMLMLETQQNSIIQRETKFYFADKIFQITTDLISWRDESLGSSNDGPHRNLEVGQIIRLTQSITMPKDNIFLGGGHHIK